MLPSTLLSARKQSSPKAGGGSGGGGGEEKDEEEGGGTEKAETKNRPTIRSGSLRHLRKLSPLRGSDAEQHKAKETRLETAQAQPTTQAAAATTTNRHSSNYLASLVNRSSRLLLHSLKTQYENMQRQTTSTTSTTTASPPTTATLTTTTTTTTAPTSTKTAPTTTTSANYAELHIQKASAASKEATTSTSSSPDNNSHSSSNNNNNNTTRPASGATLKSPSRRHALQEQSLERDALRVGRGRSQEPAKWRRATSIKSVLRGVSSASSAGRLEKGSSCAGKPYELFEPPITQRTVQRSRRRGAMLGDPRRQLSADTIGLRQLTDEYLQNAGVVVKPISAASSASGSGSAGMITSGQTSGKLQTCGFVALAPPGEQSAGASAGICAGSVVPLAGQCPAPLLASISRDGSGDSTPGTGDDSQGVARLQPAQVYPGELPWQNDVSVQCELVRAPRLRHFGFSDSMEEPYESTGDILQTIAGPYKPPALNSSAHQGSEGTSGPLAASLRRGLSAFAAASNPHHLVLGSHSTVTSAGASAALQVVGSLKKSLSNTLDISGRAAVINTLHSQDSLPAYASLRNEPDEDENEDMDDQDDGVHESELTEGAHFKRERRENSSDVEDNSPATTISTADDGQLNLVGATGCAFELQPPASESSLIGQLAIKLTRQSSRKFSASKRGLQRALSFDCRANGYKKLAEKPANSTNLSVSSTTNRQSDERRQAPHQRSALCLNTEVSASGSGPRARPPLQQSASQVDFQLPLLPYHKMQEAIVAGRLLEPAPAPPPSPLPEPVKGVINAEELLCAPVANTSCCRTDDHPVLTPQVQAQASIQQQRQNLPLLEVPGKQDNTGSTYDKQLSQPDSTPSDNNQLIYRSSRSRGEAVVICDEDPFQDIRTKGENSSALNTLTPQLKLPNSPSFCIQPDGQSSTGTDNKETGGGFSGLLSANDLFGTNANNLIKRPSTVMIGAGKDAMSQVAQALNSTSSTSQQQQQQQQQAQPSASFAGGSSIRRNRRQAIVPPKLATDAEPNQEPAVGQLVNIDDQQPPETTNCELQTEEATVRALRRKRSGGAAERQQPPAQASRRLSGALPTFYIEPDEPDSNTNNKLQQDEPARPDSQLTDVDSIASDGNSISLSSSKREFTVTSPGGLTVSFGSSSQNRRRSSIAVIPQMQICPGDLLVYSKQLIDRMNQSDEVSEPAQFIPIDDKKAKNIWSSLKLFDTRTLKARNELLCSLEDVLASLQPSTFVDEQLSHYKGMLWNEFIYETESRRSASSVTELAVPKADPSESQQSSVNAASVSNNRSENKTKGDMSIQLKSNPPLASPSNDALQDSKQGAQREVLKASISSSGTTGHRSRDPLPRSAISSRFREKPKLKRGQTVDSVFRIPLIPSSPLKHAQQHQQTPTAHLEDHDLITIEDDESATSRKSSLNDSIRRKHRSVSSSARARHGLMSELNGMEGQDQNGNQKSRDVLELDSSFETDDALDLLVQQSNEPHSQQQTPHHTRTPHQIIRQSSLSTLSSTITHTEQKRQRALWDLFQSECTFFFDHLITLKNVYMEPLKKIQVEGFAMFADPDVLFGNLDELCCGVYDFCKEFLYIIMRTLKTRPEELNATDVLIKLYKKNPKIDHLRGVYHRYTLNYINALTYLESLRRQVEFVEFEKWSSRDVRCKKLQLTDLLVAPVQHIMRVPIILKDIESHTENLRDREEIRAILAIEEASLRELDDKMRWLKNFERLLEIQKSISWPSVLDLDSKLFVPDFLKDALSKQPCEKLIVSPRRQIVHEGTLSNLDSGKACDMHVILFDDMLLMTRRKKGLTKKASTVCKTNSGGSSNRDDGTFKYTVYKQPLSLDRFYLHDVQQVDAQAIGLRHLFLLIIMNRFQQITNVHSFSAPNDDIKQTWLFKIKKTSDRWKKNFSNNQSERQEHHVQNTNVHIVNEPSSSGQKHPSSDMQGSTSNTRHHSTEVTKKSQPTVREEAKTSKSPINTASHTIDACINNYERSPRIELVVTSAPSGNSNENSTYSNVTSTATAH